MATDTSAVTYAPAGKTVGATTRAASNGGAAGAGVAAASAAIIVYAFKLAGVDLGPIESALSIVLAPLGAYAWARYAGKRTPTDQVRDRETTIVQQLPDGVAEALAALAAQAGSTAPALDTTEDVEQYASSVVSAGEGPRAGDVPEGLAAGGPSVTPAPAGSTVATVSGPAEPAAVSPLDVAPIVDPVTVEVEAEK